MKCKRVQKFLTEGLSPGEPLEFLGGFDHAEAITITTTKSFERLISGDAYNLSIKNVFANSGSTKAAVCMAEL